MNELIKKDNIVKITMNGGKILIGGILDNSQFYIKFLNKNGTLNNILINGIKTIELYDLIDEDDILFYEYFKLYKERENLRDMLDEIAKMFFEKNNLLGQQKAKMVEYVRNKNLEKIKKQEINKKEESFRKDDIIETSLEKVVDIEEIGVKTQDNIEVIMFEPVETKEDINNVSLNDVTIDNEVFFDENTK